jgi:hypothetical protein
MRGFVLMFLHLMVVVHMFLAVHLLETVVWKFWELQQQISYDCNCPLRNIHIPSNSSLQVPREIQFFPCTMSRAVESSGASLDSLPYKTKSVERSIEDQGEDPDCQILESHPTWGSNESDISWEPGRGFSNASNLANGVGVACNRQVEGDPLPKRQRKMMIRHAHFQSSSAYCSLLVDMACWIPVH